MRYVLGNVRISQAQLLRHPGHSEGGFMEEAFRLHKAALKIWRATLGEGHHKTADAYHKMGWHLFRRQEYEEAR